MIKACIIGLGPHGNRYFKALKKVSGVSVEAVVDQNEVVLATEEYADVPVKVTSINDLFKHTTDITLAIVATHAASHNKLGIELMENGILYLVITKPYTTNLKDAKALSKVAKEKNVRLGVDHILRYDHTYLWIRSQIETGKWGKLRSIYLQRPGIGLGCLGVHSFDLANFLVGSIPKKVSGWVDEPIGRNPRGAHYVDPGGLVIMDYGQGVRAIVDQIEDGSGPAVTEIIFNFARVRVDEKNNLLEVIEKDRNFVPSPNATPFLRQANPHEKDVKHDMVELLADFLTELTGTDILNANGSNGEVTIEILVAAFISNTNGNIPVHLPLHKEQDLNINLNIT